MASSARRLVHGALQEQTMQPTTNQSVPATSSLPNQQPSDRQPAAVGQAPVPLDAEMLRQISGGLGPTGTW